MRSWLLFVLCLLPMLGGTFLLTRAVVNAHQVSSTSQRDRLALWRLDAAALPIVAQESGRSPDEYTSFITGNHLNLSPTTGQLPSPLLGLPTAPLWLHFEVNPQGQIQSPQVPHGRVLSTYSGNLVVVNNRSEARQRLASIEPYGSVLRQRGEILGCLPTTATRPVLAPTLVHAQTFNSPQQEDFRNEYQTRSFNNQNIQQNAIVSQLTRSDYNDNGLSVQQSAGTDSEKGSNKSPGPVQVTPYQATWIDGRLVLLRGAGDKLQGVVCDWPTWRTTLTNLIQDIAPGAVLGPVDKEPEDQRMAVLPVAFSAPPADTPLPTSTVVLLVGAWIAVIGGCGAAAAVLAATQALSQRRAAFVSAVTHELRTPLAGLRLQSDLLSQQPEHLGQRLPHIQAAVVRLAHLVDNVLDYARIEHRPPPPTSLVALTELVKEPQQRLHANLAAVGLTLLVDPIPPIMVRCDPAAVARILDNLGDNAAKYATLTPGQPNTVKLSFTVLRNRLEIRCVDHGPGLDRRARAQVFLPFHRSSEAAAGHAPGVGLGLALARRLARAQRGDLTLEPTPGGGLTAILTLGRG